MPKKMFAERNYPHPLVLLIVSFAIVLSQIGSLSAQDLKPEPRAQLVMQLGHSNGIYAVALSPDERTILSGGRDGTMKLWDVASGRLLRTFVHAYQVTSVGFSPDGRTALSGSTSDESVKLWNIVTGQEIRQLKMAGYVAAAIFSPDGRSVFGLSSSYEARLWDVATGQEIRRLDLASVKLSTRSPMAISPDGRTALIGNGDNVDVWDFSTGRKLTTLSGHSDSVYSIAFSPDGRSALSGSLDKQVKLWDVSTGHEISTFSGHTDAVDSVAFSKDGRLALSGSRDKSVKLWDVSTGREIKSYGPYPVFVSSAKFSQDEKTFLVGTGGPAVGIVDVDSGKVLRVFTGRASYGGSIAFSPDGRTALSAGSRNEAKLWDIASGRQIRAFTGHAGYVNSVAFSPDGRTALTGSADKTIKLWDVDTGREIRTFAGHSDTVSAVRFSPDGKSFASGSFDHTLKLWTVTTGQEIATFTDRYAIESISFSPDGHFILSKNGGADQDAKIWDTSTGKLVKFLPESNDIFAEIAFSPDGNTAFGLLGNGDLVQWSTSDWRVLKKFPGHSSGFASAAFSTDRRTVLSANLDGTIKLLDTDSGRELKTFRGPPETINRIALAPDGHTALTSGNLLHVWNVDTGTERAAMLSFFDGSSLSITPEGFFDASSPSAAQNLSIVRGLEVSSVDQVYNAFYRPDLVRENLAGDPSGKVKTAATQLNLDTIMASGMAPKVIVTSPASGSSSETDEIAVEATIADQGGGIGKVEWRVNDVTLGLENRGLDRIETPAGGPAGSGRTLSVKRALSLEPGDNRIEVLAYNAKGLIASVPAQITIKWDGAKTAVPPKLYVLAVGVNDYYDSRLHLAYAVPDATALAEGFKKAGSGSGLYASVEVETVLDSDVTLANLDRVFADLSHKVQPRDVFVFFLAGHGKTKNGRYYFLPRDFRYEDESSIEKAGMGQDRFQAWFAEIPARKSLLLYDTCESGSLTGATRGSDIDERLGALNRMARATGRTFLTATTDDAPAIEGFRGHGVFTYALLDAFDHADINNDGLIDISELADYVDRKVPDYSFEAFKLRQIPQRSIVGNNFAVANKAEVLTESKGQPAPSRAPEGTTYVVVSPVDVKESASDAGVTVTHLTPGTQVRMMETSSGWALIARDGQKLGYVQASAIAGLH